MKRYNAHASQLALLAILALIFCGPVPAGADDASLDEVETLNKPVSVYGKVFNPAGEPVAGAKVTLVETGQTAWTDSNGQFRFNSIIRALVTLIGSTQKYEDVELGPLDLRTESGESLKLEFKLERAFSSTIVITGTREERMLKEVPVRTEVITADVIEMKGATTLADALDGATGLRVENNCQNCGFNQLRINGLEGGYSHVMINGLNAFSSLSSVYGLEQIPSSIVDRIEVVKGGGSALYGAGAVGGVVNVITKQPLETSGSLEFFGEGGEVDAGGGGRGYGSWVGNGGTTALFAYGSLTQGQEYDRDGDGFTELPRKQLENGGLRVFQRVLDGAAELQASYDIAHEWRRGGSDLDLEPHETELTEWIESTRHSLSLDWTHSVGADTFYSIKLAHSEYDRDTYYGGGYDPYAYGDTVNPHTNIAMTVHHDIASHDLVAGVQYERDHMEDSHPGYGRLVEQTYQVWGVFLQDDFRISDDVTLLFGGRYDDHEALKDGVFSPRISLMWAASEHIRFRANFAQGFKAPVVFDEDLHIEISGGSPQFIYNDPDLKPEEATTASLSAEFTEQNPDLAVRLEGNFFYTYLTDTFVLNEVENTEEAHIFTRINSGSSDVYGLELNADLNMTTGFGLQAGFTWQATELDEAEPDFGATEFFRTPDTYGYLTAMYRVGGWAFSSTLDYTGTMLVPHYAGYIPDDVLEESSAFYLLHARVAVPVLQHNAQTLTLMLNARNITDDYQNDFDQGPDRDSGYIYGPRIPRTFSLGLKYDF